VVFIGVTLALSVRQFALVNVALIGVWFVLVVAIAREHRKLTAAVAQTEEAQGRGARAEEASPV